MEVVDEAIERTHRVTGMPKDEIVRRGLVRGEIPIYGLVGGALGLGSLMGTTVGEEPQPQGPRT